MSLIDALTDYFQPPTGTNGRRRHLMWFDPKDCKPDNGDVFVMLFTDGSGAAMIFKRDDLYFDNDGVFEDDHWREIWGKWCKIPEDYKTWAELH